MQGTKWAVLSAVGGLLVATSTALAFAETTVELKGVHLCCGACVKGVAAALKGIEGVSPKCDREAGTVTLTATDASAARKALDALGDAGYYGESSDKALTIKPGEAASGKSSKVTVSGLHNCCRSCAMAIKTALKGVKGVTGDTAASKSVKFEVTGDFEAADLVKALNKAGFNASAK
jgi:copper chaperone CopZ